MANLFQRCVLFVALVSLVACTSLQQLPEQNNLGESTSHRQVGAISIGDSLRVIPKQGDPFDLVVTAVAPDKVTGLQNEDTKVVPLSSVASFEQRRFDVLRTTLVILAVVLVALGQYAKGATKLNTQ